MDKENDAPSEGSAPSTTNAPRAELRFPLAFDSAGNPLKLPPNAVRWRIRRGGGKRGRPRNLFDSSTGRQLEVPIGASHAELCECNLPCDRYLLYPVDAEGIIIPGLVAVTEVTNDDNDSGGYADDDYDDDPRSSVAAVKDPALAECLTMLRTIALGQHKVITDLGGSMSQALGSAVAGYAPVRAVSASPALPPHVVVQPSQAPQSPTLGLLEKFFSSPDEAKRFGQWAVQKAMEWYRTVTPAAAPPAPLPPLGATAPTGAP